MLEPLAPSRSSHTSSVPDCRHPDSSVKPRGNRTSQWWTCVDCGARWKRAAWQERTPSSQDVMQIGRHKGQTYESIPQSYQRWA
eukprot:2697184-Amphidinium_carterae.1